MLSGNSVVCVRHSPLMKRFIRWLHQYIGGYYIKHHVLTQSRPLPDLRAHYPISLVQVSGDSAECQVFGKQIDIMTASLRPSRDSHYFSAIGG
jgi:hypothetical protein